MKTEVRNRIHTIVDRLFPGFLNEKKSGVTSIFKQLAIPDAGALQRTADPSPPTGGTDPKLRKTRGLKKPKQVASKLQEYASQVLTTPEEYTATLQISLASHVNHYRCLFEEAQQLANEMAQLLAKTQGAFITSIRGVGIVLAAGVTRRDRRSFGTTNSGSTASYAGIIPKVKQTGGRQGLSLTGHVSKRSNHILKDYVVQSAFHIGRYGPKDIQEDFNRREAAGQHADFASPVALYVSPCV